MLAKCMGAGGGLLQLVATGQEDVYLSGDPGHSFFQTTYKRHTPFAIQTQEIELRTEAKTFGESVVVTIPKKGDLISKMYVRISMKKGLGSTYFPAEAFLQSIELSMGSQVVDTHTAEWLRIKSELLMSADEKVAYRRLTDFADGEKAGDIKTMWVPLRFFFNEHAKAFPLLSLTYHTITLRFTFASYVKGIDPAYQPKVALYGDFIFLGDTERRLFAHNSHKILFEQVQMAEDRVRLSPDSHATLTTELFFRYPVRYLAWTNSNATVHARFAAGAEGETSDALVPLMSASLLLNGHERVESMPASYWNLVTTYSALQACPCAGVFFYSFCTDPRNSQAPTGSCNLSRISRCTLMTRYKKINLSATAAAQLTSEDETVASAILNERVRVYASSWNILKVENGQVGVTFAS